MSGQPVLRIDVGGHDLAYSVSGNGFPPVIIEPGYGGAGVNSKDWRMVISEIEKETRVVVYDRANLGLENRH